MPGTIEGLLFVGSRPLLTIQQWKPPLLGTDLFIDELLQGRTKAVERPLLEWCGPILLPAHRSPPANRHAFRGSAATFSGLSRPTRRLCLARRLTSTSSPLPWISPSLRTSRRPRRNSSSSQPPGGGGGLGLHLPRGHQGYRLHSGHGGNLIHPAR